MNKFALGLAVIGAITASIGFYNIAKGGMSPRPVLYEQKVLDSWTAFKAMHVKSYSSDHEERFRLANFYESIKKIDEINSNPKNTFTAGLNKFSDLSSQEFSATYLGLKPELFKPDPKIETLKANPDLEFGGIDWVAKGGVTPVKDQGGCGSCWSFATTGALENLDFIQNGHLRSFSEQQLVDCDVGSYYPPTPGDNGCYGGLPMNAFEYTAVNGITTEAIYPYFERKFQCKYNRGMLEFANSSYRMIDSTVEALKTALEYGVVAVGIDGECLRHYESGVYNYDCFNGLNHAVLVVGYKNGWFGGNGYFKVKNSWNTTFGEAGYFYISDRVGYYGNGIIGVLSAMSQAI